MLWKKTDRFWKNGLKGRSGIFIMTVLLGIVVLSGISGCNRETQTQTGKESENSSEEADRIAETYRDIYENAEKDGTLGSLKVMHSIIHRLGQNGYIAVDSENQVDMTGAERVEEFCTQVEAKETSEITVIVVDDHGGFTRYVLMTKDGDVKVNRDYYVLRDDKAECTSSDTYSPYTWEYTEEGYLFFEKYQMSGYDGPSGHTALRVQPLDETCRRLNRQYIMPIGYASNDLFLSDWNEMDVGDINFYDLFDILYSEVYGEESPYVIDENYEAEPISYIPKEEFEQVILSYFRISREVLQSKTTYNSERESYQYRPRGRDELESPEVPYPEVTDYAENEDETITLTVNVVFPEKNTSKVYAHEVVIRPLDDGKVQYVSNRIIPSEDNQEATWHVRRLTVDEWEQWYGKDLSLMSDDDGSFPTQEQIREMGEPVMTEERYSNLKNYEKADAFLKRCQKGKTGTVAIYEVREDGSIGRRKYIFDGSDMFVLSTNAVSLEDNTMRVEYISCIKIKEWEYTEKGWFCYELCVPEPPEVTEIVDGSCLIRIKPLTQEQQELSRQCVAKLGYQGNNLLCSDWDMNHLEDLDYNGMYESLYRMKYQEEFPQDRYRDGIPKEEFENLIMEYISITSEQIQEYAVYDTENHTYAWSPLGCQNFTPTFFGTSVPEVTDIRKNEDGTVTLTVDAVCDTVLCSDAVITHELTIRFSEDGAFQYLSNKILGDGIQDIPEYQCRIRN